MMFSLVRREYQAARRFRPAGILTSGVPGTLLIILFAINSVAIASDVFVTLAGEWGLVADENALSFLRLDDESGLWSPYGYGLLFITVVLLVTAAWRHREAAYLLLAVAFFITALDDSLALHETFGSTVPAGAIVDGDQTLGRGLMELAFLAGAGMFVLGLLVGARLIARPHHHTPTLILGASLLAIGFCAVVLNFGEAAAFESSHLVGKAFSLLDDGGELFASSLAVVIATWTAMQPQVAAESAAVATMTWPHG